ATGRPTRAARWGTPTRRRQGACATRGDSARRSTPSRSIAAAARESRPGRSPPGPSSTLEPWRAAFARRADALRPVARPSQAVLPGGRGGRGGGGRVGGPAAQGGREGGARERRRRGDLGRERWRARAALARAHQPIAEADACRLVPADATAGVEQVERVLLADDCRQGGREREAVMEAEAGRGGL